VEVRKFSGEVNLLMIFFKKLLFKYSSFKIKILNRQMNLVTVRGKKKLGYTLNISLGYKGKLKIISNKKILNSLLF
jgi:hypothetical protein